MLTLTDYSFFRNKPVRFENSIQINDANEPWPRRWFMASPMDTSAKYPLAAIMPLNASSQNGNLSFCSFFQSTGNGQNEKTTTGYITCDKNFNPIDTFNRPDEDLDHHEFVTDKKGEKLFFVLHDTVMDMRKTDQHAEDSALHLSYRVIEITNASGHVCFRWDPMKHLGSNAEYPEYRKLKSNGSRPGITDWGHGNSLSFDFDGNILYSYRSIGIGKISRQDGHIIWKIDRKELKPTIYSDSILCYLQHGFRALKNTNGHIVYTFLSNGDNTHKSCSGIQFTIRDTLKEEKIFSLRKTEAASRSNIYSSGQGNYNVEPDGSYLLDYGTAKGNNYQNECFEYEKAGQILPGMEPHFPMRRLVGFIP